MSDRLDRHLTRVAKLALRPVADFRTVRPCRKSRQPGRNQSTSSRRHCQHQLRTRSRRLDQRQILLAWML